MKPKFFLLSLLAVALIGVAAQRVYSHCQIPCGIYDDEARFKMMLEDVETIRKSMTEIRTLSSADEKNFNQLVRWVTNKEEHADRIIETVTHYFLAQRVQPVPFAEKQAHQKYQEQLAIIHKIIIESTKAKQTTEFGHANQLESLVKILQTYHQK